MSDPRENIRWKLWRAHALIDQIDGLTKEFLHSKFYTLTMEQDRKRRLVFEIRRCQTDAAIPFHSYWRMCSSAAILA